MSAIDDGVRTALQNDAALTAACPDGVHQDQSPDKAVSGFVVWSLESAQDDYTNDTRGETCRYRVEAITSDPTTASTAAARIHAVMESLTVDGYHVVSCLRQSRVNAREGDTDGYWWREGGEYELVIEAA